MSNPKMRIVKGFSRSFYPEDGGEDSDNVLVFEEVAGMMHVRLGGRRARLSLDDVRELGWLQAVEAVPDPVSKMQQALRQLAAYEKSHVLSEKERAEYLLRHLGDLQEKA